MGPGIAANKAVCSNLASITINIIRSLAPHRLAIQANRGEEITNLLDSCDLGKESRRKRRLLGKQGFEDYLYLNILLQ